MSEKEFTGTNYKRLQKALVYIENNLIGSDGGMYLTVDSLKETNNIITGSNNITLRKVNVKPYGFDKMYMDKELIEDKLYQIKVQFNERKIMSAQFYSILLNKIHPFYDGNGRTCWYNKTKYIDKLSIKQCYHIPWSVEKIQKVKIQKLQGQKIEE